MITLDDAVTRLAVRTTQHLTGGELYRLLHRYDLDEAVRDALWREEEEITASRDEVCAEQWAETGHCMRWQTRLERYLDRHPLYACDPMPWHWGLKDDDIPF